MPAGFLSNPVPDFFDEVSRMLVGPVFGIDGCFAGGEIGLFRLDKRRALENLPEGVECKVDWNTNVPIELLVNRWAYRVGDVTYAVTKF